MWARWRWAVPLGTIAVIVRQKSCCHQGRHLVVEAPSVMLQVTWFKFTKKAMAKAVACSRWRRCTTTLKEERLGWRCALLIITMLLCLDWAVHAETR